MGADNERLEGELLGFTFRAEDGSFAVARLKPGASSEVIVVGPLGHVSDGQHLQLEGRWMEHPQFGRQFKVSRFLVGDPRTLVGLERYLASEAVQGLGPTFARRVVERFGLDTLRVLEEEPARLREVPGIGPKRLAEIVAHWQRDQQHRELSAMLRGYGVGQKLVARIIEKYGKDALAVVSREPYRLASEVRGVGFRTADTLAQAGGISPDDPRRVEAATLWRLDEAEGQGHCFLPEAVLLERVGALDIPPEAAASALERLIVTGRALRHGATDPSQRPIYAPRLERAEQRVASRLRRLVEQPAPLAPPPLSEAEESLKLALNATQRRAVQTALQHGVTVITGGPGTGKTTIVRVLVAAAMASGQVWKLAAPTGRAARRLSEATGVEAVTLHRLLEYNGRTGRFQRSWDNPLEANGVLVDEASMVDLQLMDWLLAAIPPACRLVLVGDADQLPSVGAGRVLGDIIASGALPVCTLDEVYRQAADSCIVRNAHRVNAGQPPISREREPVKDPDDPPLRQDFFVLEREEPDEILDTLRKVMTDRLPRLGFDPHRDVQVLTPVHGGPLGTEALNEALQALLNPVRATTLERYSTTRGAELVRGQRRLRVGDRIIQVKNNYDLEVFNGDVGRVLGVEATGIDVDFEGRTVSLTGEQLEDVELAYAISIHKSQGSEYPAVIVILHRSHRIMLRRNLLYTALTRARRFCCLLGARRAFETAAWQRGGDERWTRLADHLAAEGEAP